MPDYDNRQAMVEAVAAYVNADHAFTRVTQEWVSRVGEKRHGTTLVTLSLAKVLAKRDVRRQDASGDRVHYAAEATMFATVAMVELLEELLEHLRDQS